MNSDDTDRKPEPDSLPRIEADERGLRMLRAGEGVCSTYEMSELLWLLLCHAVDGAQTPDEVSAMDPDDFAIRKQVSKGI
jgi:hypothetical protein